MNQISLSELRTKLSSVIEKVKQGETVVIMERGKPVAMITVPNIDHRWLNLLPNPKTTTVERTQEAQRRRDDILRGVNRKS